MKNFFKNYNAGPVLFLITYQVVLVAALPFYLFFCSPAATLWAAAVILFCCGGLSITFGYHRLFSHKAFKAHPIVETIALFFGSMTFQGSCLRWSYEHRIHHAHVDTDLDPYSIKKGFWYAHCLWLINKPQTIENRVVADLLKNPRVMWQHKYGKLAMIGSNVLVVAALALLTGDLLGSLLIPFGLRLFMNHHTTWFINSLAHTWGAKEFCNELSAVDNFVISLLTFGEGYHNYHHTFSQDYRNGIRWYHFDPTKWLIWTLSKLHLANNLRRVDTILIKKKIIREKTEVFVQQLDDRFAVYRDDLRSLADRICDQLGELAKAQKNFSGSRELRQHIRECRKSLKKQMRRWKLTIRFLQKTAQVTA